MGRAAPCSQSAARDSYRVQLRLGRWGGLGDSWQPRASHSCRGSGQAGQPAAQLGNSDINSDSGLLLAQGARQRRHANPHGAVAAAHGGTWRRMSAPKVAVLHRRTCTESTRSDRAAACMVEACAEEVRKQSARKVALVKLGDVSQSSLRRENCLRVH